jgi:cytochrome b561
MQNSASEDRYSRPAVFFHWAVFALVALAYLAIEMRGPKGSESRIFWSSVHFWAGTLVFTLAVFRLAWRLWRGAPAEIEANVALTFLARLVHVALYLFIFVQPLLGILTLNTGGHPLRLAGLNVEITLVATDTIARHAIKNAHEWIGNAFYFVIGLHALGALTHHIVFRDRTLRRML